MAQLCRAELLGNKGSRLNTGSKLLLTLGLSRSASLMRCALSFLSRCEPAVSDAAPQDHALIAAAQ